MTSGSCFIVINNQYMWPTLDVLFLLFRCLLLIVHRELNSCRSGLRKLTRPSSWPKNWQWLGDPGNNIKQDLDIYIADNHMADSKDMFNTTSSDYAIRTTAWFRNSSSPPTTQCCSHSHFLLLQRRQDHRGGWAPPPPLSFWMCRSLPEPTETW